MCHLSVHRQRWRNLLLEVLTDVVSGVESALELRYLRDVEQLHALPTGTRNEPEKQDRSIQYAMSVTALGMSSSSWTGAWRIR